MKFKVGDHVKHHRVTSITGIVVKLVERKDHPAGPWFYTLDVNGQPNRLEADRTFAECVLEKV